MYIVNKTIQIQIKFRRSDGNCKLLPCTEDLKVQPETYNLVANYIRIGVTQILQFP